ncbi:MAG: hypothetical protein ACD_52C00244G0004 [uncultured bacterium]|nr:MAG: hypothetical protein ACD_52C00244G0004 [uncultured bacterium]
MFLPILVYGLNKATGFLGKAFGTKANLVVDVGTSFADNTLAWNNLAQGGEERTRMFASVLDKLASLTPRYLRIDHVYDFYDVVKRGNDGKLAYDWSKLDLTLNDMHVVGAAPFLSLSYMPLVLSGSNEIDVPHDWREWSDVVKNTVEHVSGKDSLGREAVYYEIWNEPDLFGGFAVGGKKDYGLLYKFAVEGANQAKNVHPFKIGGPAITNFNSKWMEAFIKFVDTTDLRLDFLSWHRYGSNMADFDNDLLKSRSLAAKFPSIAETELVLSETGYDSEINKLNDETLAAIHTIATSAVVFPTIDKVFAFEIKDGPGESKYWGRWGVLTHEKFGTPTEKPRFAAIKFLNQMTGDRLTVLGQGTWVKSFAVKLGLEIKLLIVNYDKYGKHSERVPINFVNLPPGKLSYKRVSFLGNSSDKEITAENGNYVTSELLLPNSAAIIVVEPK